MLGRQAGTAPSVGINMFYGLSARCSVKAGCPVWFRARGPSWVSPNHWPLSEG